MYNITKLLLDYIDIYYKTRLKNINIKFKELQ